MKLIKTNENDGREFGLLQEINRCDRHIIGWMLTAIMFFVATIVLSIVIFNMASELNEKKTQIEELKGSVDVLQSENEFLSGMNDIYYAFIEETSEMKVMYMDYVTVETTRWNLK